MACALNWVIHVVREKRAESASLSRPDLAGSRVKTVSRHLEVNPDGPIVPCHALHAPQHAAASPFGPLNSIIVLSIHYENAYSNILKILQPKQETFQIKNSDILLCFCLKHRLWVLVRTASARRF